MTNDFLTDEQDEERFNERYSPSKIYDLGGLPGTPASSIYNVLGSSSSSPTSIYDIGSGDLALDKMKGAAARANTHRMKLAEKEAFIKSVTATKMWDLSQGRDVILGYDMVGSDGTLGDADSPSITDAQTGELIAPESRAMYFDSVDKRQANYDSRNKIWTQLPIIEEIFGQSYPDIPDWKLDNFYNWQHSSIINFMANRSEIKPFNPDAPEGFYTKDWHNTKVKARIFVNGKGEYGRSLIHIIDPKTGEDLTYLVGKNPYLNMAFNYQNYSTKGLIRDGAIPSYNQVFKMLDEEDNEYSGASFLTKYMNRLASQVSSSVRQVAKDFIYFAKFAEDPNTDVTPYTRAVSDLEAGVSTKLRKKIMNEHQEGIKLLQKMYDPNSDNVDSAIDFLTYIHKQAASNFAESAGISGSMMLTQMLTNPMLAKAISMTKFAGHPLAKALVFGGSILISGLVGMVQQTAYDVQRFEEENKRKPTRSEALWMGVRNLPMYMGQSALIHTFLGMFGKQSMGLLDNLFRLSKASGPVSVSRGALLVGGGLLKLLGTVGAGEVAEGLEEYGQEAVSYMNIHPNATLSDALDDIVVKYGAWSAAGVGGMLAATGFAGRNIRMSAKAIANADQEVQNQQDLNKAAADAKNDPIFVNPNPDGTIDPQNTQAFNGNFLKSIRVDPKETPVNNAHFIQEAGDQILAQVKTVGTNVAPAYNELTSRVRACMEAIDQDASITDKHAAKIMIDRAYADFFSRFYNATKNNPNVPILGSDMMSKIAAMTDDLIMANYTGEGSIDEEYAKFNYRQHAEDMIDALYENIGKQEEFNKQREEILKKIEQVRELRRTMKFNKGTSKAQKKATLMSVRNELLTDVRAAKQIIASNPSFQSPEAIKAANTILRLYKNQKDKLLALQGAIEELHKGIKDGSLHENSQENAILKHAAGNTVYTVHVPMIRSLDSGFYKYFDEVLKEFNELANAIDSVPVLDVLNMANDQAMYVLDAQQVNQLMSGSTPVHIADNLMTPVKPMLDDIKAYFDNKYKDYENLSSKERKAYAKEDEEAVKQGADFKNSLHTLNKEELELGVRKQLTSIYRHTQDLKTNLSYATVNPKLFNVLSQVFKYELQSLAIAVQHFKPQDKRIDTKASFVELANDQEFMAKLNEELAKNPEAKFTAEEIMQTILDNYDNLFDKFALQNTINMHMDDFIKRVVQNDLTKNGDVILKRITDGIPKLASITGKIIQDSNKAFEKVNEKEANNQPITDKDYNYVVNRTNATLKKVYRLINICSNLHDSLKDVEVTNDQLKTDAISKLDKLILSLGNFYTGFKNSLETDVNIQNTLGKPVSITFKEGDYLHKFSELEASVMFGIVNPNPSVVPSPIKYSSIKENVKTDLDSTILGENKVKSELVKRIIRGFLGNEAYKSISSGINNLYKCFTASLKKGTDPKNHWVKNLEYKKDPKLIEFVENNRKHMNKFAIRNVPLNDFYKDFKANVRIYPFIYDFTKAKMINGNISVPFSTEFAAYTTAAIHEFFNSKEFKPVIDPQNEEEALRALDKDPNVQLANLGPQAYQFVKEHGVKQDLVINSLGKLIMDHMNLHTLDTGYYGDNAKLIAHLGTIAFQYLQSNDVFNYQTGKSFGLPIFITERNAEFNGERLKAVKINPAFHTSPGMFVSNNATMNSLDPVNFRDKNGQYDPNKEYMIFDIETAGDSTQQVAYDHQYPIQIAAQRYNGKGEAVGDPFLAFIAYDTSKYQIAEKFYNGKENAMFKTYNENVAGPKPGEVFTQGEDLHAALKRLETYAQGTSAIVGHNIKDFDMAMCKYLDPEGSKFFNKEANVDTLEVARLSKVNHNDLPTLAKLSGVDENVIENAHDARVDIDMNNTVLRKMLFDTYDSNVTEEFSTAAVLRTMYKYMETSANFHTPSATDMDPIYTNPDDVAANLEDTVRHTNGLIKLSESQMDELRELGSIPHTIVPNIAAALSGTNLGSETLCRALGWKNEYESRRSRVLSVEIAQKGKNDGIERQIKGLIAAANVVGQAKDIYYKYFKATNNRTMQDGVYINPQSNKELQRFLMLPKDDLREVTPDVLANKTFMHDFFRIVQQSCNDEKAQALFSEKEYNDIVKNGQAKYIDHDQIIKNIQDLIKGVADAQKLTKEDRKNAPVVKPLGVFGKLFDKVSVANIDNLGQLISVYHALMCMNNVMANGKKETIGVLYGLDCANSGAVNRELNLVTPLQQPITAFGIVTTDNMNEKIITDMGNNMSMMQYKRNKGLDSYEAAAQYITDLVFGDLNKRYQAIDSAITTENDKNHFAFDTQFLVPNKVTKATAIKLASNFLDSLKVDDSRNLVKPTVMTHMYHAGVNTTSNNLAHDLFNDDYLPSFAILNNFLYDDAGRAAFLASNTEEAKQANFMINLIDTYLSEGAYKDVLNQLAHVPPSNIMLTNNTVKDGSKSLQQVFNEYVKITVGIPLKEDLDVRYDFTTPNDLMTDSAEYVYKVFQKHYDLALQNLKNQYKDDIPNHAYEKMVRDLRDIFPTIPSFFDGDNPVLFFSKFAGSATTIPVRVGDVNLDIASSDKNFSHPGFSAAVTPIHAQDSYSLRIQQKINKYHDSTFDEFRAVPGTIDTVGNSFNGSIVFANATYSVAEQFRDLFDRAMAYDIDYEKRTHGITEDNYMAGFATRPYGGKDTRTLAKLKEDIHAVADKIAQDRKELYGTLTTENGRFEVKDNKLKALFNVDGKAFVLDDMNEMFDVPSEPIRSWEDFGKLIKANKIKVKNDMFASTGVLGRIHTTNNNAAVLTLARDASKAEKMKIFEDLAKSSNMDPAEYNRLKEVMDEAPLDFHLNVYDNGVFPAATFNWRTNTLNLYKNDPTAWNKLSVDERVRLAPYNRLNAAQAYAHDVNHASLVYGLMRPEGQPYKARIIALQDICRKTLTWQHLLPKFYDSLNPNEKAAYDTWAKEMYNTMFNNHDVFEGIVEFASFAITDPVLSPLLGRIKVPTQPKVSIMDRLFNTVKSLFNLIFGQSTFKEAFSRFNDILLGSETIFKYDNVQQEMLHLYKDLVKAQVKAINAVENKNTQSIQNALGEIFSKADKGLSDLIEAWVNSNPTYMFPPNYVPDLLGKNGKIAQSSAIAYTMVKFPTDKNFRFLLYRVFSLYGQKFKEYGFVKALMRDFRKPSEFSMQMDEFCAQARIAEEWAKDVQKACYHALKQLFGEEDVKNEYKMSRLTHVALAGDMQCLLSKFNIDQIRHFLINPKAVETAIKEEEATINGLVDPVLQRKMYKLAEDTLAFLKDKKSALFTYHNATQLTQAVLGVENEELINAVDRYLTLRYLKDCDASDKLTVYNLKKEGFEAIIAEHQDYIRQAYEDSKVSFVQTEHIQKGYVKYQYDGSTDIRIGKVSDSDLMAKRGFSPIQTFNNQAKHLCVYKRAFPTVDIMSGGALPLAGYSNLFKDIQNNSTDIFNDKPEALSVEDFIKTKTKELQDARLKQLNDYLAGKYDGKMDTIRGDFGCQLDDNGNVTGFFIAPFKETCTNKNGGEANTNGVDLMAYMRGNAIRKMQASAITQNVIQFLKHNQELYFDKDTGKGKYKWGDIHSLVNWVKVAPDSEDQRIKENWDKLPIPFKEYCKNNELYMPEDGVLELMGVHQFSLVDTKMLENVKPELKGVVALGENALRYVCHNVKQKIVFLMPSVLTFNFVCNYLTTLVSLGPEKAKQVLAMQWRAFQDTKRYMDADNELLEIQERAKTRLNRQFTSEEIHRMEILNHIKETSPIKPLVDANLFSSIIQDTELAKRENIAYMKKKIENTRLMKYIRSHKRIEQMFNLLTLNEKSGIYRAIYIATQYSDFIARAAEYYIRMDNAKNINGVPIQKFVKGTMTEKTAEYKNYERDLIRDLRYKFINYEKPVSDVEQMFNDVGGVFFTKFRKRIQWVIGNIATKRPLSLIASMFMLDRGPANESLFVDPGSALNSVNSPPALLAEALTPGVGVFVNDIQNHLR